LAADEGFNLRYTWVELQSEAAMDDYRDFVKPTAQSVTYGSYLKVHDLLALQQELSQPKEHDETLFIIIHQVYELWFKQILHELNHIEAMLDKDKLGNVIRSLKRISTIQRVLIQQVDILETMTPDEFNRFRSNLNPASGFQSHQFRVMEFRLGLKNMAHFRFFQHDEQSRGALETALHAPTLYDVFLRYLSRQGHSIPAEVLNRKVEEVHEAHPAITKLFQQVYENPDQHYQLYIVLEGLVDLDEFLVLWRYRHVQMVRRMIGDMGGTGGSLGARYLQSTLTKQAFPELWDVRNHLGKAATYGSGSPQNV
jgi:tryptophan 2,3-dioxygenase